MTLTRRTLLRGLGGAAVALPLFHSLGAPANVRLPGHSISGFPKRLLIVYKPNGFMDDWFPLPGASESTFDLSTSLLAPLAPYRDKLLLLRGLDMSVHNLGPGEPHQQGMAFLTGRRLNEGNQVGGDGSLSGWASGISVDQHIANAIGGGNRFRSRQFGVQSTMFGGTEVRTVISYAGSDQPIPNEVNPYTAFTSLFSDIGADPLGVARLRARRHSVLDAVGRQFDSLIPQLGSDDRLKLDQHLTAVRDVEARLDNPGAVLGASCHAPSLTQGLNLNDPANYGIIGDLMMDLVTMTLACDLTRVATLQWSASTNNRPYPFLSYEGQPLTGDEHVTGHAPDSDLASWGRMRVINTWFVDKFKALLDRLNAVPEGDGTMLDNTIVVLASEITKGNTHSHMDNPILLVGSGGGALRTGRMIDYGGEVFHNNLLVSLMNALDMPDTTFGEAAFCTGPLSGLT